MTISRVKTWSVGEVLSAVDLNAEFDNILTQPSAFSITATGSTTARLLADRFAEQFHVYDYGAVCDGTTNDSTAIQAAITAAGVAGGRVVFPPKVCAISTGLTNTYNNVWLIGQGAGANRGGADDSGSAATVIKWTGSAGGVMYDMGPTVGAAHNVTGGGIENIFWNGNKVAGTGVNIRSVRNNVFRMTIAETTTVGLDIGVENTVTTDPPDTQQNWFESLVVIQQDVASGIGIRLKGGTVANTSLNHFGALRLLHYSGVALDVAQADGNLFDAVHIFRAGGGAGIGVLLRAGTTPAFGRANVFTYLQAGAGGLTAQGTASGSTVSSRNSVLYYSLDNGTPVPVVEQGASFSFSTDFGRARMSRADTFSSMETHRASSTAAQILGKYSVLGHNSTGGEVDYAHTQGRILTNTNGAEDGEWRMLTKVAGADVVQLAAGSGVTVGVSPTGSYLGAGTLNAKGNLFKNGASVTGQNIITYSASMTPDHQLGSVQRITVSNGTAFTINDPINSITGIPFTILIRNASGGAHGAITWGAGYKMAGALPAIATANSRTVVFHYDGTNWVEMFRSAADVAN